MEMGLTGEGRVDDSVWIIKTHYPERIGRTTMFADRCIVIVRNPLDAIFSLFNMVGTTSHNLSLKTNVIEYATQQSEIFSDFIRQEVSVLYDFHEYWLRAAGNLPVHFVTYESLLVDPAGAMTSMLKFLLNIESLEGTHVEKLVHQFCRADQVNTA